MILKPSLSIEEQKEVAKIFGEELKYFGEWWLDNLNTETIKYHLKDDLENFPKILREEMIRKGAKIE